MFSPCPGMLNNCLQLSILRTPAKYLLCQTCIRHQHGWISYAALPFLNRNSITVLTNHFLGSGHYLLHGKPTAIPQVKRAGTAQFTRHQMIKRQGMRRA